MEKLQSFEFWEKTLKSAKYVVAPMVDASELAWRMLSRKYGAELCYSPMFHSSVFVRDPGYRRDALASCEGDRPLIVQFCANDPETLLAAAKMAEEHCDAIDLNLGCPQQIARRGHYGAFLQDEWELIAKMVSTCAKELKVPITVKIRIFEDMEKTIQYAKMIEQAGAQLLTVHGRTREMKGLNTGIADWKYVKAIRENVNIPVFSNGNIQYLPDVQRCIDETGVQGVMSAEGNLHNPALFHGIQPPVWDMCLEYIDMVEKYPCPMNYVRGHIFKIMVHALNVHKKLREEVGSTKELSEMRRIVLRVKEQSRPDVDQYNADPDGYKDPNGLPFPYWICQPYVRPTQEEREEKLKEKTELAAALQKRRADDDGMSKNQAKKIKRNPGKNFERKGREHYVKCEFGCGNIRGMNCRYNFCKTCCRSRCFLEIVDCVGHKNLVKTKREKRLAYEAAQAALAENANNENIDNQNKAASQHSTGRAPEATPSTDPAGESHFNTSQVPGEMEEVPRAASASNSATNEPIQSEKLSRKSSECGDEKMEIVSEKIEGTQTENSGVLVG